MSCRQQSADLAIMRVPVDGGTGRVTLAARAGSTLEAVETKQEIREFLTSRRARITPERAGLNSYGGRRVPGLRREEVAVLAGVSVPYYTRLERGDMNGVSESHWLGRCSSTTPSVPTSTTSPAPRHRPR